MQRRGSTSGVGHLDQPRDGALAAKQVWSGVHRRAQKESNSAARIRPTGLATLLTSWSGGLWLAAEKVSHSLESLKSIFTNAHTVPKS